jgi:sugar lactone lactonase YvrE
VRGPDLYALDSAEGVLYRFGLDGRLRNSIVLGSRDLGTIDAVDFVVDKAGELWVLDRAGNRLLRFGRNGEFLADLAEGAVGDERLSSPTRLALDPSGGVFVLEPGRRRVRRFSRQGELLGGWRYDLAAPAQGGPRAEANSVADLVVSSGEVVLVDGGGRWVRSYSPDGELRIEYRLSGHATSAAALSSDGVLCLARPDAGEIARIRWTVGQDDGAPGVR